MFRRFVSVTLLVSIVALGSSGLLMIILDSFKFQLQMHPVYKVFGIIMCAAGCIHVDLNFKPIRRVPGLRTLPKLGAAFSITSIGAVRVLLQQSIADGVVCEGRFSVIKGLASVRAVSQGLTRHGLY